MSKFECKNCGFIVEQETQPESCPICGGHEFTVSGSAQNNVKPVENAPAGEADPAPAASRNSYAQFREFPTVQRDRVRKDLDEKLNTIQNDMAAFEGRMEAKKKGKKDKEADLFAGIFGVIFLIGLLGSSCAGCVICMDQDSAGDGFKTFIITLIAGLIISSVVSFAVSMLVSMFRSTEKKDTKNMEEKRTAGEEERKSCQEAARKSISEYSESFDRAVKETVQRFVSNKAVEEIGNRILGNFLDDIEKTPRDAGHKDVLASCQYAVYTNQVQYGGGIFSFSQNHCSNLAGPVEQAALGQAIAAYLEIRVLEKYDRDPCGSVPQIIIHTEDTEVSRTVIMTYKAANVNYRGL